ncbi:uncharacterized protein LOC106059375 isoform X48 [Biomphalaria glabrata]|uniref:Uncharacterized protein LOC106059375 isoform X48 n=1 Tax=Biomphalaria glabrata TaxID=6526 RepID=A0A9W2ZLL0_BIOGL|nr:uncharacterized protein LOC106059375 isoform X48 [Biomphalaria glabrata]
MVTMDINANFLISFMVDARGGAMRGCRHPGVRVIIPPRKCCMPTRITCRLVKKEKLTKPPPMLEGEGLAARVLEMGPAGTKFLGPILLEVPHFASLRGKEREVVILRSDNGETWYEHPTQATEDAVAEALGSSAEELDSEEDLSTKRIKRILTTDLPMYFALVSRVTRVKQESTVIGTEGGVLSSNVVPQVQAVFPEGTLRRPIPVGLQAQPIAPELVAKLLGNRVAVSPIVTIEPRRRQFHKPITLTIPVPKAAQKGMINQYGGERPTLRLLFSLAGNSSHGRADPNPAVWEDVTDSKPMTLVDDCVSFTTKVSARFWLIDCQNVAEAAQMASILYQEAVTVPYMAKFVVFAKRDSPEEGKLRIFCMTDDKDDKTLEKQEKFYEVARSRDIEVLEGRPQFVEMAGNLIPVTKSGDQLHVNFRAFRENRLPCTVKIRDQDQEPSARVAFMKEPKVARGEAPQTPICNLNIRLPDMVLSDSGELDPDKSAEIRKRHEFLRGQGFVIQDTVNRAEMKLSDIADTVQGDWVMLAQQLHISISDINHFKNDYKTVGDQALAMLHFWLQKNGDKATGNELENALRRINRDDVVRKCMYNIERVEDEAEVEVARAIIEQTGLDSKDSLKRGMSLDVQYDEQDMIKNLDEIKESESAGQSPTAVKEQIVLERRPPPTPTIAVTSPRSDSLTDEIVEASVDQRRPVVEPPIDEEGESRRRKEAFVDFALQLDQYAELKESRLAHQDSDEQSVESVKEEEIVKSTKTSPTDAFPTWTERSYQQVSQTSKAHVTFAEVNDVEERFDADEEEVQTPPPSPTEKLDSEEKSEDELQQEVTEIVETYRVSEDGRTWKTIKKTTIITAQGTTETVEVLKEEPVTAAESSIAEAATRLESEAANQIDSEGKHVSIGQVKVQHEFMYSRAEIVTDEEPTQEKKVSPSLPGVYGDIVSPVSEGGSSYIDEPSPVPEPTLPEDFRADELDYEKMEDDDERSAIDDGVKCESAEEMPGDISSERDFFETPEQSFDKSDKVAKNSSVDAEYKDNYEDEADEQEIRDSEDAGPDYEPDEFQECDACGFEEGDRDEETTAVTEGQDDYVDRLEETLECRKVIIVQERPEVIVDEVSILTVEAGDTYVDRSEETLECQKVTVKRGQTPDRPVGFQVAYTSNNELIAAATTLVDDQESLEVSGDHYSPGETYTEEVRPDGTIVRHRKIRTTKEGSSVDMEEFCEETPAKEETEVEDHEEIMADGTVHTTHTVRRHSFKKVKKHLKSVDGDEKEEEITEVIPGSEKKEIIETFDEPPRMVHEEEEMDEILDDGTKVHRKIILNRMVHRIRTHQESFDSDHGRHVEDYEIDEIIPGTESAFLADPDSDSSSSEYDEHEVEKIQEKTEILDDGTIVKSKLLTTESTHKTRSRTGSIDETEIERIVEEESITPSPRPRSPVDADPYDVTGKQPVKTITKTSHIEESVKDDVVERTLEVVEDMIATGALKSSEDYSDATVAESFKAPTVEVQYEGDGNQYQEAFTGSQAFQSEDKYELEGLKEKRIVREQLASSRTEHLQETSSHIYTVEQTCQEVDVTEETVAIENIGIYEAAIIREEVEHFQIPRQDEEIFSDTFESMATIEDTQYEMASEAIVHEEREETKELEISSHEEREETKELEILSHEEREATKELKILSHEEREATKELEILSHEEMDETEMTETQPIQLEDEGEKTPVADAESPLTDLKYVTLTDPVTKELVREKIETIEEVVADMERKFERRSLDRDTEPLSAGTVEPTGYITKDHELAKSELTEDASETTQDVSEIKSELVESLESQHDIESYKDVEVAYTQEVLHIEEYYHGDESEEITPACDDSRLIEIQETELISEKRQIEGEIDSLSATAGSDIAGMEEIEQEVESQEDYSYDVSSKVGTFSEQLNQREEYPLDRVLKETKQEVEGDTIQKANVGFVSASAISLPDESEDEIQEVISITKAQDVHSALGQDFVEKKQYQMSSEELEEDDQDFETCDIAEKELTEFEETELAIHQELESSQELHQEETLIMDEKKHYYQESRLHEHKEYLTEKMTGHKTEEHIKQTEQVIIVEGMKKEDYSIDKEECVEKIETYINTKEQEQYAEQRQEQEEYVEERQKEVHTEEQEEYVEERQKEVYTEEQEEYVEEKQKEEVYTDEQEEFVEEKQKEVYTEEQEEYVEERQKEEVYTEEQEEYVEERQKEVYTEEQEEYVEERQKEEEYVEEQEEYVEEKQKEEENTEEQEEFVEERQKEEYTEEQEEYLEERQKEEVYTEEHEEYVEERQKEAYTEEQKEFGEERQKQEYTEEQEEYVEERQKEVYTEEQEEYVEERQKEYTEEQEEYVEERQKEEEYVEEKQKEEEYTEEQEEFVEERQTEEYTEEQEDVEERQKEEEYVEEQKEYVEEKQKEDYVEEQEEYVEERQKEEEYVEEQVECVEEKQKEEEYTEEQEEYVEERQKEEYTEEQEECVEEKQKEEYTEEQEEYVEERQKEGYTKEQEEYVEDRQKEEKYTEEQEEYFEERQKEVYTEEQDEYVEERQKEVYTEEQDEYVEERQKEVYTEEQEEYVEERQKEVYTEEQEEYVEEKQKEEYTEEQEEYVEERQKEVYTEEQDEYVEERQKEVYTEEQDEYVEERQKEVYTEEQEEYVEERQKEVYTEEQEEYVEEKQKEEYTEEQEEYVEERQKEVHTEEQEEYVEERQKEVYTEEQDEYVEERQKEEYTEEQEEYVEEKQKEVCTEEQEEYEEERQKEVYTEEQEEYVEERQKEIYTEEQDEYVEDRQKEVFTEEQDEYVEERQKEVYTEEQEEYVEERQKEVYTEEQDEYVEERQKEEYTEEQEEYVEEKQKEVYTEEQEEYVEEKQKEVYTEEQEEYVEEKQKEVYTEEQEEYVEEKQKEVYTEEQEEYVEERQKEVYTEEQDEYVEESQKEVYTEEQEEYVEERQKEVYTEEHEEYVEERQKEVYTEEQEEYVEERQKEEYTEEQGEYVEEKQKEVYTEEQEEYVEEKQKEVYTEEQEEYVEEKQKEVYTEEQEEYVEERQKEVYTEEQDEYVEESQKEVYTEEQEEYVEERQKEVYTEEHEEYVEERLKEVYTEEQDEYVEESQKEVYTEEQEEYVEERQKEVYTEEQEEYVEEKQKEVYTEEQEEYVEERQKEEEYTEEQEEYVEERQKEVYTEEQEEYVEERQKEVYTEEQEEYVEERQKEVYTEEQEEYVEEKLKEEVYTEEQEEFLDERQKEVYTEEQEEYVEERQKKVYTEEQEEFLEERHKKEYTEEQEECVEDKQKEVYTEEQEEYVEEKQKEVYTDRQEEYVEERQKEVYTEEQEEFVEEKQKEVYTEEQEEYVEEKQKEEYTEEQEEYVEEKQKEVYTEEQEEYVEEKQKEVYTEEQEEYVEERQKEEEYTEEQEEYVEERQKEVYSEEQEEYVEERQKEVYTEEQEEYVEERQKEVYTEEQEEYVEEKLKEEVYTEEQEEFLDERQKEVYTEEQEEYVEERQKKVYTEEQEEFLEERHKKEYTEEQEECVEDKQKEVYTEEQEEYVEEKQKEVYTDRQEEYVEERQKEVYTEEQEEFVEEKQKEVYTEEQEEYVEEKQKEEYTEEQEEYVEEKQKEVYTEEQEEYVEEKQKEVYTEEHEEYVEEKQKEVYTEEQEEYVEEKQKEVYTEEQEEYVEEKQKEVYTEEQEEYVEEKQKEEDYNEEQEEYVEERQTKIYTDDKEEHFEERQKDVYTEEEEEYVEEKQKEEDYNEEQEEYVEERQTKIYTDDKEEHFEERQKDVYTEEEEETVEDRLKEEYVEKGNEEFIDGRDEYLIERETYFKEQEMHKLSQKSDYSEEHKVFVEERLNEEITKLQKEGETFRELTQQEEKEYEEQISQAITLSHAFHERSEIQKEISQPIDNEVCETTPFVMVTSAESTSEQRTPSEKDLAILLNLDESESVSEKAIGSSPEDQEDLENDDLDQDQTMVRDFIELDKELEEQESLTAALLSKSLKDEQDLYVTTTEKQDSASYNVEVMSSRQIITESSLEQIYEKSSESEMTQSQDSIPDEKVDIYSSEKHIFEEKIEETEEYTSCEKEWFMVSKESVTSLDGSHVNEYELELSKAIVQEALYTSIESSKKMETSEKESEESIITDAKLIDEQKIAGGMMDELQALEDQQYVEDESSEEDSEDYEQESVELTLQQSIERKEIKLEHSNAVITHRKDQALDSSEGDDVDMEQSVDRLETFTVEEREEHTEKDLIISEEEEKYWTQEKEIETRSETVIEERCHILSSKEVEFTKEDVSHETTQDFLDYPETFIDRKEEFMELISDCVDREEEEKERFISCEISDTSQDRISQGNNAPTSQQTARENDSFLQGPVDGINMGLHLPRSPFYPTCSTEVQDRSGSPSDLDEEITEMENKLSQMKQMVGFDEDSPEEEFLSPEAASPLLRKPLRSSEEHSLLKVSSISGSEYASQSDVENAQSDTTGTGSYYTAHSEIMSSSDYSAPSDVMTASECTAQSETMTGSEYTVTGSEHEDDEYESEGRLSADISQQIFLEQNALRFREKRSTSLSSSSEEDQEDDTCRLDRPPSPSEFTLIASQDQSKLNISLGLTSEATISSRAVSEIISETSAETQYDRLHVEPDKEMERDSLQGDEEDEDYDEEEEEEEEEDRVIEEPIAGDRPPSPSEFTLIASQDKESLNKLLGLDEMASPEEEQESPMLWEHELEKAMMDVDAQSTASSDAALMIGLDRMSAAGTDNNTMSGVSSESGQQPDSNEDQLYAETPDDEDGKDTEELYQAYMKVTEDNEDRSKDSDVNFDNTQTQDSQISLYQKDESKDTLYSEADYGSPQAYFEEVSKEYHQEENNVEESSFQVASESTHRTMTTSSAEFQEMKEESSPSQNLEEHYLKQESRSHFENRTHSENVVTSSFEMSEGKFSKKTFEMSELDKQFLMTSEDHLNSKKYSVNSEYEASWSTTLTERLDLCDNLASRFMEGDDELGQNAAMGMSLHAEDKMSSSSSEVAQLDDFDNQDVEIREASEETSEETDVEDQFSPVVKQTDESSFSFEPDVQLHHKQDEFIPEKEKHPDKDLLFDSNVEDRFLDERETSFLEEEEVEDFDHTELEPELCVLALGDEQEREDELEISEHPSGFEGVSSSEDKGLDDENIHKFDIIKDQESKRTLVKQETRDISPEDLEEKPLKSDFPDDYMLDSTDHYQELIFQTQYEMSYAESQQYETYKTMYEIKETLDEEEETEEPSDDAGKEKMTNKQSLEDIVPENEDEQLEASGGADVPATPDEDIDLSSKSSSDSGGVEVFDEQTGTYSRLPWEIAHQYKRQFSESFNEEQKACVKAQKSIDLGTFYRRDRTKDEDFMERSFYDEADTSDIITVAKRKVTFELKHEESGNTVVSEEEEEVQPKDESLCEPYECIDATHEADVISTILESRQKVKHEIARQVFDQEYPDTPKQDSQFQVASSTYTHQTLFDETEEDFTYVQRSEELYTYSEVNERVSVVSRESRMAQQELLLQESFDEEDRSLSPSRDKSCKKLSTTFEETISVIPPPHPTHFPMAVHSVGKSLADNEIYESSETERDSTEEKLSPIEETPGIDDIEEEDTTLKSTPPLEKRVTFQTDRLTTRASEQSVDDFKASSSSSELSVEPTLLAASYDLESGSVFHIVTAYDISPDTVEKQGPIEMAGKSILSSPEDDVFETDSTSPQRTHDSLSSDTPAFILYGHLLSGAGICSSPPIPLPPVSTPREGSSEKVDLSSHLLSASSKLEMLKHTERLDSKDGEDTTLQEDDMSSPHEEEIAITEMQSTEASPESEDNLDKLMDEETIQNGLIENFDNGAVPLNQSTEASVNVNAFPCVLNGPTEVHYIPEYDGGDDDIATVILPGAQPVISFLQRDFSPPSHEDIIEPEMSSSYEAKPDIQQPEEEEEETREVEEPIHPSYALTRQTAPDSEKYEEENVDYADSIMPTVISFVLAKPDIQQPEEEVNVEMEEPLQATIMTTSQAKPDIQQPEDKEDVPDGEEIIQPSIMTTSQAKPDIQQPTEDQGNGHPVVEDPVQSSIVNVTQMSPTQYLWEQVGSSGYKISQEFVDEEDAQALKQEKDLLSLSSGEDEDLRNLAEQEESLSPYSAEKEELEEVAYEFSKETVYHGKRALDVDIADMAFSGAYEEQEDAYQQDYAVCGAEPAVEHESAQQEGEEEIEEEEEFEERPEEELIRLEEPPTETDDDTEENLKSHDIKEEKSEVESFEHSSADFLRVGVHSDLDRPLSPTPDALRQGFFGGNFTPPQGGAFTPPQSGMFTPPISDIQTPPHLSHEHETIFEEAVVIEQTASTFVESILEDVKTQVSSQECSPETEMEHDQIDEFDSSNYVIDDSKTEDYNNEYQSLDKFSDSEKRRGITLVKQISEDIPGIVLTQYLHQEMNEDEFYGYSPQNENISEDEEDNYEEELEIQETSLDDKESKLDQTEEKNIQDTASHPMLLNLQESDLQSTEGQSETPTEQKLSEFSQEAAFDQKLDSFLEQYTPSTGLGLTEAFQSTALEDQIFFNQDPQYGFEDGSESVDLYMSQEDHADTSSVDSFATVVAAEAEDTDNYEPDENRLAEIASMTSSFTSDIHVPITEDSQKETSDDVGDTEDDDTSMETSQEWTSVVSEEKDRESDASIDSDRFEFVDRAALSIITEMSDEDKFEMIEREDLESEAGLSDQFGSSPDNNIQQSPGISTFRFFGRGTDRDDASISSSLAEFEQMEKAIPFSSSLSSLERDIDKECFGGSYDERKFVGFPRLRGEDSTSIASSLAEFEHLEQVLVVSSSASSVEKQTPESKSSGGSGDNTSNSISSSLADFEKIEQDCQADSDEKKSSVESSCRQSEASSYTSLNEFERLEREIAVASELEVEAQKIVSILESGVLMGSAQFGSSDFSDVGAGDEDDGGQEDIDHDSLSEGGRLYHDVDGDSLDGESSEITEMASSVVFAGPELVASQPILDLDNDSLQGEALMQLSSDSLILEQRMKTSDSAKFDTDSLIFDTDSLFEQEDRMVRSADSLELGGQSGHSSAGGQSGHSSAGPSSEKREEKMVQIEDQMQTSADSLELDNSKEETKEEANKESHLEDSLMMGSMESAAWSMGSSGGTGQSMSESHTDSSQSHDIMQVSTESDILKANAKSAFSVEQRSEIITEETHHYSKSETFQWCQEDTSVQYISEGAHPFPKHFDSQSKYKRKSKTQSELEEFLKTERQEKMDLKSKTKRESPKFFEEDPVKEESPFLSWGPYQETKKVYTMVEWEEMKRLKREKQEQEARAAAQSSSSPDLSQDSQEDRLQSSSSQSPPSVKMTLTSSSTYTSTHSRGERSGYEERTSGDEDDGGDGKPEGDDQYSSGAHGDDDDVQTHRLMMKKEVHKKTTIGLDGQEHTTIREDSQVQQDNEPPEELRESMQEIINQFMESDPQPAHLLPAESKEDEV